MSTAYLTARLKSESNRAIAMDEEPLIAGTTEAKPPSAVAPQAFYGLAGEIVHLFEPHTEGDPAALLFQFLVAFGNLIGRKPFVQISASKHYCNLFAAMIGNSSTGRKGTSWDCVAMVLQRADEHWWKACRIFGLGSGEGLIAQVSDPEPISIEELSKPQPNIPTPKDKRGMVVEGEFASVLKVFQREGSVLSPTVRNAWDSGDLRVTVKKDTLKATGAHISIIGHCTVTELSSLLSNTDMFNGVGNRFIWVSSKRSKLLPMPGLPASELLDAAVARVTEAAKFAKAQGEIKLSAEAEAAYRRVYCDLVRERPGLVGVLTARSAPIVLRLSAIYALLDLSSVIQPEHLAAALSAWEYSERSVEFIFGKSTGDRLADKLLAKLIESPAGLTQTEILEQVFGKNVNATRVGSVIKLLTTFGLIHSRHERSTAGRKVIRWLITSTSHEFNEPSPPSPDENSLNSYLVEQNSEEKHVSP